jgi:hypothetical protein
MTQGAIKFRVGDAVRTPPGGTYGDRSAMVIKTGKLVHLITIDDLTVITGRAEMLLRDVRPTPNPNLTVYHKNEIESADPRGRLTIIDTDLHDPRTFRRVGDPPPAGVREASTWVPRSAARAIARYLGATFEDA